MTDNTENASVGIKKYFPIEKIFATSFILKVVELFSGFFVNFFLSRILSTADYGKFVYGFNIVFLLALLCAFGFEFYLVKETVKLRETKNMEQLKGLFRFANSFVLVLSSVFCVALIAVSYGIQNQYSASLILQALLLPVMALALVHQAFIRGHGKIFDFLFPINALRPVLFIVILAGFYFSQLNLSLLQAIGFNIATYSIGFVYLLVVSKKLTSENNFKSIQASYTGRIWLTQVSYFFVINGLNLINNKIDVFILGLFRPAADVGVYGIANRIGVLNSFLLMAFTTAYTPVIAKKYVAGEMTSLQELITKNIRFISFLTALFTMALFFFGKEILLWFGKDYQQGFSVLLIIAFGHLVNVCFGPSDNVLIMTGNEKFVTKAVVISGIISLVLHIMLVPEFGIIGTAIASTATVLTWNILEFYYCSTKVKINTSIIGKL